MPQGLIAAPKNHNNIHFLDFWILCFLLFVQYDEIDANIDPSIDQRSVLRIQLTRDPD